MFTDFEQYLFPIIMISVLVLIVSLTIAWFVIFTAVRAALRSVHEDEHRIATSQRYGIPPR